MDIGRNPGHIKRILSDGLSDGYISPQFLSSLQSLRNGFNEGKFKANASTREEFINRTETVLQGLPYAKELAEDYCNNRDAESLGGEGTEAHFRVRMLNEINVCQKRGGVILPDGNIDKDVVGAVIKVVQEIKPELKAELLNEGSLGEKRT